MRAIVCCKCQGVPKHAEAMYKVIKKEVAPIAWYGHRLPVLLETLPQGTPIYEHVLACSKSTRKFAYLFEWDMDGKITKMYNLLNGKEIS